MANGKKSFIAYVDWKETFDILPDDKAGKLIKHLFAYVNDEYPQTDDILITAVFANIKQTLKRDLRKYEDIKRKRVESGRIGGIKSGEARGKQNEANEASASKTKQNEAKRSKTKQNEANEAVSVNDSVNDSVNVNDNTKELIDIFENFRKDYPGTKRGLYTELENLKKKYKEWKNIIPLLPDALTYQKSCREVKRKSGGFVPEWKNLQTWINQKCWEEEIDINNNKTQTDQPFTYRPIKHDRIITDSER